MPRAKRGFKARRRRNRVLKQARGFYGARGRTFANAVEQLHHAWADAYKHRRTKKRDFRKLWITRINAGVRTHGLSYSRFIAAARNANVGLDRKILADLAMNDPKGFEAVVQAVKS